ncbi:MAG: hypothetical protein WCA45_05915 [Thiobacillaceae bacterium]
MKAALKSGVKTMHSGSIVLETGELVEDLLSDAVIDRFRRGIRPAGPLRRICIQCEIKHDAG